MTLPSETTIIQTAARELDLAVDIADVYRTDASFAAEPALRAGHVAAIPTLLGPS